MKGKNWIIGLVFIVLVIVAFGIWGFKNNAGKSQPAATSGGSSGAITPDEPYFSNTATVMYFYQPNCGHCINESSTLTKLAQEGYRVKPMNAFSDNSYWAETNPSGPYKIDGTPTFIAANGDRLVGEQTYDQLKKFLDDHK